jgi:hypothetical protein
VGWQLALLPLAGPRFVPPWLRPAAAGPATGLLQGVLVMKASTLMAAGALLGILGLGYWLSGGDHRGGQAPRDGTHADVGVAPSSAGTVEVAERFELQRVVASLPAAVTTTPVGPVEARPASTSVEGRCLDAALLPIQEARVVDPSSGAEARTEGGGHFALTGLGAAPRQCELRFEAPGHGTRTVSIGLVEGQRVQLGDVILAPGGSVVGTVLDGNGHTVGPAPGWTLRDVEVRRGTTTTVDLP